MNLFIGNLSPTVTEETLKVLFSEFGVINSVKIITDPITGAPKGFGFVDMEDKYHAKDAITHLDFTYLEGNIISVKEANNSKSSGSGKGGFDRNRNNNRPNNFNKNKSSANYSNQGQERRPFNSSQPKRSNYSNSEFRSARPTITDEKLNNIDDNKWNSLDY